MLCGERDGAAAALQFSSFTVEGDEHQLELRVTHATRMALPDGWDRAADDGSLQQLRGAGGLLRSSSCMRAPAATPAAHAACSSTHWCNPAGLMCAGGLLHSSSSSDGASAAHASSGQLSAQLSQQMSGLLGRCFSQTDEGFTALPAAAAAAAPVPVPGAAAAAVGEGDSDYSDAAEQQDEGGFWGSPLKQGGSAGWAAAAEVPDSPAAAGALAGGAEMWGEQDSPGVPARSTQQHAGQQQPQPPQQAQHTAANSRASCSSCCSIGSDGGLGPPLQPAELSGGGGAGLLATSFNSFREISRLISAQDDGGGGGGSSPGRSRRGSRCVAPVVHHLPLGIAARVLEEAGSWGTPRDGSSWGTPREQQRGGGAGGELPLHEQLLDAAAAAAAAAADEQQQLGCGDAAADFTIPAGVHAGLPRPLSRTSSLRSSRERLHRVSCTALALLHQRAQSRCMHAGGC